MKETGKQQIMRTLSFAYISVTFCNFHRPQRSLFLQTLTSGYLKFTHKVKTAIQLDNWCRLKSTMKLRRWSIYLKQSRKKSELIQNQMPKLSQIYMKTELMFLYLTGNPKTSELLFPGCINYQKFIATNKKGKNI